MKKLVLYFNFEDQIFEYHLPAINNRRIEFDLQEVYDIYPYKVNLEVWDGNWFVKGNKDIEVLQNGYIYNLVQLLPETLCVGHLIAEDIEFAIITLEENHTLTEYRKYFINDKSEITLGSDESSDIFINKNYVSRNHAIIQKRQDGFYIKDLSENGTFLNGKRLLGDIKLQSFDEVYIMGIKLVFINSIVAVNGDVEVNLPLINLSMLQSDIKPQQIIDDAYFSRAPRSMEPLDEVKVEIEAAPTMAKTTKQPLLFILGPSVTMPLPIMLSVLFNMANTTGNSGSLYLGTIISVVASAGLGVMWAVLHRIYDKKTYAEQEQQRVDGYIKYIEQNDALLESKHNYIRNHLERQFHSTSNLINIVGRNRASLWNRNVNHNDFLVIRLGKGKIKYPGEIVIPKERFSLNEDELAKLPFELYEKYKNVDNAVSSLSLFDNKLIGVIGDHDKVINVSRSMIVQIAALHSYTDVKIAYLFKERDNKKVQWMRWLPHVFSSDKKIRYMANDYSSYQNVLYALTSELRTRDEENENEDVKKNVPHYVVFCTAADIIDKEPIYSYMVSNKNYGFTFVLLYERMDFLPNECVQIIQSDSHFSGHYSLEVTRNETDAVVFDQISIEEAEYFAKSISGIYVNEMSGGEIPTSVDFLEMMKISKLEQWDLLKQYKENRVYEKIQALLGITYGNKPMYLDIHEKMCGPHGLVAGTTGSGKSETLMTFILSLAMKYHPDEVAFVLIDYKGGGMAAPFIGMPHTAGTITNIDDEEGNGTIDENQTRRALVSIHSEIRRRQKIFNQYKLNHIDSYIRLYRDGEAKEPLPHLIIISDEFAELKKEQPEFIKELVSTARVGRSLGIHLILATQKPTGVVDDEIWSNSRFKICLRVQDKQDSMGMLKRPEAAYITGIGRAYLQIGNDEIFEMFQSGYAGAGYEPSDEMILSQHNEVSMISLDGNQLVKPQRKNNSNLESQLDACINYIKKVAKENGIKNTRQLWLPALKKKIYLANIEEKYHVEYNDGIKALVGIIDDPEMQDQYPAIIDMLNTANLMVVGNIGVGKTYFIQTMIFSLVSHYNSKQFNFYCLDFSSRTFKKFVVLPHCGGVAYSEEEEAIEKMLQLILSIMSERKLLFEEKSVGNFSEYIVLEELPFISLIIDNYLMFKEIYEELEEKVQLIIREGFKYGVQVICAGNSSGDLNYRTRQYISKIIPLYLGEKSKYMEALNTSIDYEPSEIKGRGLWYTDRVLEFQTALIVDSNNAIERNEKLERLFGEIISNVGINTSAKQVKTIPKNETYEQLLNKVSDRDIIPLGYNEKTLEIEGISIYENYCYVVSAINKKSVQLFFRNLTVALEKMQIETVFVKEGAEYKELFDLALRLKNEFTARSSYRKSLDMDEEEGYIATYNQFSKIVIRIDNLYDFVERIYATRAENEEELYPIFELFFKQGSQYGILFVAYENSQDHYNCMGRIAGKNFLSHKQGIHFGGKLDQQKIFDFNIPISKQMKALDLNIGSYLMNDEYYQIFMPIN